MANRRFSSQAVLGVLVILVGLVLLLETTDVYEVDYLLQYVPSLFVLLGLYALVVSGFRNVVGAGLVIVVAGAWQLVALDYVQADQLWDLWPLVLVFFGLSILLGQYRSKREPTRADHPTAVAIFGGSEPRSASTQFTGADLTALFGGVELDVREASIADPPAHISTTVAFGGAEIRVPDEWDVRLDVLPLFGGASDERSSGGGDGEVDLVVTGVALFGGVSIE